MAEAKYIAIYRDLKQKISAGTYPVGSMLPSGDILAAQYETSRITLRKALDILSREGVVARRRGAGTTVTSQPIVSDGSLITPKHLLGTRQRFADRDFKTQVLSFTMHQAGEELAGKLHIAPSDVVYRIVRLRIVDDQPVVVEYTYMPVLLVPGLTEDVLSTSIYQYLTETLQFDIDAANIKISGVQATAEECKWLQLADESMVIENKQTGFLTSGTIFEYSISHHVPSAFSFQTVVKKEY